MRFLRCVLLVLMLVLLGACASTDPAPVVATAGAYYKVKSGDTLYRISRAYRCSVQDLMRWNNLTSAQIEVGQQLRVRAVAGSEKPTSSARKPPPATTQASEVEPAKPAINLQWPAKGNVIASFAPPRNKGIDIAGTAGDPIVAAAAGKVVYAGSGMRSYGQMVIVQHAGNYLTTYAHNQALLVKEGDQVKAGQLIAQMGATGTDRVKLHFELRFKGNPVDPTNALPTSKD